MPFPYDADDLAAIDRLETLYNGDAYNADTNPGGLAVGGHRINFEDALQDIATAGQATSAAATAAGTSATNAATSETNAAASAAKLSATSTTSLAIGTGSKAFTTQADKLFPVGSFVMARSAANPTLNYMTGQVTAYTGTTLTVDVTVVGGSGTFADWAIAIAGSPGSIGLTGATGATGPTPNVQVTFSTGTTDSDPGNGLLKFNNASPASTTQIYADNLDRNGTSITAWLDSFDDSTNTALRGTIKIVQISDPTKFAIFNVTGSVVDGTGYRKIPVAYVLHSSAFTNAAVLAIEFVRTGNAGLDGNGAGDVIGPASATDNHVALFDGITGKLLKGGGALSAVALSGDADDVAFTPAGGLAATNVQAAIQELDTEKAALASPTFTGTPAAPTAAGGTNTTQIATTAFVKNAVDALVSSAPGALDTLDELAAALGDDANFAATVTTALAGKQPLNSELTGSYAAYADVASASTADIGAAASAHVRITGTTTITSFGTVAAGTRRKVRFAGALTLTYNATSLILPTAASLTTAANDTLEAVSLGSGNWIVTDYQRATGQPVATALSVASATVAGLITGPVATNDYWQVNLASGSTRIQSAIPAADTRNHALWYNSNGLVGSITTNGTATTYSTSSDYRLKLDVVDLAGSGEFIDALKPRAFVWRGSGERAIGFIAHEFAEISPSSVSGEKDAVDEKGEAVIQTMQASSSEVMAHIIAELQALRRRVAELEGRGA